MKGVLFLHLRSFLEQVHPRARWDDIMCECGIAHMFAAGWDYPDRMMFCVADAVCRTERLERKDFWYRFGTHSMREFRKNYHWYFDQNPDARAFLLSIDAIHADAVKDIRGARPPRFSSHLSDDRKELVIDYRSDREMVDYLRGALVGVLDIYGEAAEVELTRLEAGGATFRVRFT